ncbi:MAG: M3 family metallopeptidase [Acidobacteria bacterium]|jgi:peptidyl-dipeptidase Dcp|nr:M3 family metallopeptidase [Acidobacteriota bacterium]
MKNIKNIKNYLLLVFVFWLAILSLPAAGAEDNPFLKPYHTPFNVPPFAEIKVEHYLPALKQGIAEQQKGIQAIIANPAPPTFANTIEALDSSDTLLRSVENVYNAMRAANTNEQLQAVAREISPLLARNKDDINLNGKLFQRVKDIYIRKDRLNLSEEQQFILDEYYTTFVRGGADLKPLAKEKLRKINEELSVLSLKFGDNVLASSKQFLLVLEKQEDLSGLPEWVIDEASQTAVSRGFTGKWAFTLDKTTLIPFLQFSEKRELREKLFNAYITTCHHSDPFDNKAILAKIVSLRIEKAKLLGYGNFAEFTIERNMAKKPGNVYDLLYKIWNPALVTAKNEAAALQQLIDKEGGNFKLQPWDWWFYAEKLRKSKYNLEDDIVRPYFKLENVRDGAFQVANKLYGLKFIERTDIPKYHPDVHVFEVQEADGSHVGILYTDYFPRPNKQSGAWANNLRKGINKNGKRITPVVTNNGNFTKPTIDRPSLLNFDEVKTLFHEFGHGLNGLLSQSPYYRTIIPRDFAELPSQIMENWALEPEVLKLYARHYQTGALIPQELIDTMNKAALFNKGFDTVEYLAAAFLDMDWHTLKELDEPGKFDVEKFDQNAMNKIGLIPEIVVRYRSPYFGHIFRGGYPAGYYGYEWSEVLDADAFEAFKETSLFDQKTAQAFRKNILEKSGAVDPMVLYIRFRGAAPKIEPLLKRNGFSN